MVERLQQSNTQVYGLSDEHVDALFMALEQQDNRAVLAMLKTFHVADIADVINLANAEQRRGIIDMLRQDFDPEILVELEQQVREDVIELLGTRDSAIAVSHLDTEDAVDVVEHLDEDERSEILEAMDKESREELEEGLAYPEDSAGRLLAKNVVTVPEFWTVGHVIDHLRSHPDIPTDFYQIFVVDPKFIPVGGLMLSRIISSKRDVHVKDIMDDNFKTISPDLDQEDVAFVFRQYGLVSAPVVNEQGRMIGAITVDDVVDVMEEEAEEDILHLGGIVGETDLYASLVQTTRQRFPWLVINLLTAVAASIVIAFFEDTIARLASLAVLMPIVASMGGNAGTQTLTIAVRAIATKELTKANRWRVIGKEGMVGLLNGCMFAIIAGVLTFVWYDNLSLSVIFGLATLVTLLLAGCAGALIPLGLVRIGVDPAIASSVVLTTVTDMIAFGAFLGLAATWLL